MPTSVCPFTRFVCLWRWFSWVHSHSPGVAYHTTILCWMQKALGMPDGAPPPWLINMQRYGPPPAYASMKIPGVFAVVGSFGLGFRELMVCLPMNTPAMPILLPPAPRALEGARDGKSCKSGGGYSCTDFRWKTWTPGTNCGDI